MGDALDGITIRSSLRVLEGDTAPFELLATRFDGDRPRVKMRSHRLKGAVPVSMGWMEVGDSPASGWHVVAISPADTVLLSPLGNPLRLRLVPGDGPAGHPGTAGSGLPLEEHDGP